MSSSKGQSDSLLVPKLLYFLLNWVTYSTHTYLGQFVGAYWGITNDRYQLSNIAQLANFVGALVWGSLADRSKKYKLICSICCLCAGMFATLQAFPIPGEAGKTWNFTYFCVLCIFQHFFGAGTFALIDAICLSILNNHPKSSKDAYGKQKMWGTVAHNICTKVLHFVYKKFGDDFNVMFYSLTTATLLLVSTLIYGIPDNLKVEAHKHGHHAKKEEKKPTALDVGSTSSAVDSTASVDTIQSVAPPKKNENTVFLLLKSGTFLFFLFSVLGAGLVRSVHTITQSLFITDVLGQDKSLVADAILFRLPFELGLLFYAKEVMAKVGVHWFFVVGQAAGLLRMLVYTMLTDDFAATRIGKGILISMESLKGANSSMVSASAVKMAAELAPEGCSGAAQTLVAGTWQGISMGLAAILGFLLVKTKNLEASYKRLYIVTSVIGALCLVVVFCRFAFIDKVLFKKRK